jgi:hypothetical protein
MRKAWHPSLPVDPPAHDLVSTDEPNRRNAHRSTGPNSEEGKRRLTADTDGDAPWPTENDPCCDSLTWTPPPISPRRQLTLSFQPLANLDSAIFNRLGRYEATLARQTLKTIFLLRSVRSR